MTPTDAQRDSGPLIDIDLADGRSIWCWQYLVSSTRVGIDVVRRACGWDEASRQAVRREASILYGSVPVLFIEPPAKPGSDGRPRVRLTALFASQPLGETAANSSLVIAWIQDRQTTPDAGALASLREVDWERWAADEAGMR
jgi:hypothetical protein